MEDTDICPTVRIVADVPGGHIVINECDLTDEHKLFDAPKKRGPKPKDASNGEANDQSA